MSLICHSVQLLGILIFILHITFLYIIIRIWSTMVHARYIAINESAATSIE